MKKRIGSIKFVEGDFADNLEVRGWICSTGGTVKMFCNNYGDNFGTKAQGRVNEVTLDKKLATMFASTRPGTVLVTLHPLDDLPPSVEEWDVISRERATTDNEEKSFYSRKVMDLGEARDCVSWSAKGSNTRRMILYIYTRLGEETPLFSCTYEGCEHVSKSLNLDTGKTELQNSCVRCTRRRMVTRENRKKAARKVDVGLPSLGHCRCM